MLLGLISVGQAGLNRRVGMTQGWPLAALLNNSVLFILSLFLFALSPSSQSFKIPSFESGVLYALPGILGIFLVSGIPWAISKWGATPVFVGLIASQILGSLAWDFAIGKSYLTGTRFFGVFLTLVGALLTSMRN